MNMVLGLIFLALLTFMFADFIFSWVMCCLIVKILALFLGFGFSWTIATILWLIYQSLKYIID